MGAVKKPATDDRSVELRQNITEHCLIKDRIDALEKMLDVRKKRIHILMEDIGLSKVDAEAGSAAFTERRSFTVVDPSRLAKLFDRETLAANVRITADVYDAAIGAKIKIDKAVRVGLSPSLSVTRARSKQAREQRKQYIAESKAQAEKRIATLRKTFAAQKGEN